MAYQAPLNGGRINATISGNTAGAGSLVSTGTMTLAGGNNIVLSQAGNAITISGSNPTANLYASGNSTQLSSTAGVDLRSMTFQGAGNVSVGMSQGKVLISGSGGNNGFALYDGVNTISSGTARISAGGGLSASINGQTLNLSAPAVSQLTYTGAVSMASNGNTVSIGAPIMSLGMNTSTAGGATAGIAGTVSNGINFVAGSNITLSQSTGINGATMSIYGASGGGAALSAGTQSANAGTINFANSNGVSFGMSGSSRITASVATDYAASNHSHGNPTLALTNLSGSTASASNGFTLSLSASPSGGGGVALVGGGSTYSSGSVSLTGAGALTVSPGPNIVSISAPVVSSVSATGALSISTNGNTVYMGVPAFSAGIATNSTISNRIIFAGGNNITLSQSIDGGGATVSINGVAGGGGTLSMYAAGNTTQNSSTTMDVRSVRFNGLGGMSAGYSNGSVQLSAPSMSYLIPTGALSISTSSNSISIGVSPGAVAPIEKRWMELMIRPNMANVTTLTAINGTAIFQPFFNDANLTVSRINWEMSRVVTGSNLFSVHAGIYSYVNNTQISLLGSVSESFSNTNISSVSGIRRFAVDGLNVSTFAPGGYVLGMLFTAAATASMNYLLRGGASPAQVGAVLPGADQYNTAVTYNIFPFWGRYTVSSAALPNSVADSQIRGQFSGASQAINWWVGLNND